MMPFQDVPTHIPEPEVVPKAERDDELVKAWLARDWPRIEKGAA
jgi:hypothetical protein